MATPKIAIDGLTELRRSLAESGEKIDDLRPVYKQAAGFVADTARALAPSRSGTLASTIRVSGTKRAGVIRVGNRKAPYAAPIHWGWPGHNIKPNRFMTEAASNTEPQWLKAFEKHVQDALNDVKGQ